MTFGAAVTVGMAPRYSESPELLGSCSPPPDGSVSGESAIAVHCEAPLPRLLSRIAPLSALTMSGVAMT